MMQNGKRPQDFATEADHSDVVEYLTLTSTSQTRTPVTASPRRQPKQPTQPKTNGMRSPAAENASSTPNQTPQIKNTGMHSPPMDNASSKDDDSDTKSDVGSTATGITGSISASSVGSP